MSFRERRANHCCICTTTSHGLWNCKDKAYRRDYYFNVFLINVATLVLAGQRDLRLHSRRYGKYLRNYVGILTAHYAANQAQGISVRYVTQAWRDDDLTEDYVCRLLIAPRAEGRWCECNFKGAVTAP